jgi:hypothetical protein
MHWTLPASSTSFHLADASTGEPHLYCSGSLTNRHYLSRLERHARELHLRTAIAVHLPRLTLIACGAAAVLFGLVAAAWAEGPAPAPSGQISAECAARDLQAITFIEQRGEAGDLPAAELSRLGFMQLEARRSCTAGDGPRAVALYDDILGAVRIAERVEP